MHLIMATDYAIRAMLYLALTDRMASASEISEKVKIPKQYLVTMSKKLKEANLMNANGGHTGGYYLARPPEEITLLDIISVTENASKILPCMEAESRCGYGEPESCSICKCLSSLQGEIDGFFAATTLRELADLTLGGKPAVIK